MSCDNWERGTIIIPRAEWAGFRKSMIEAWNAEQERMFALAVRAREVIETEAKGKRGFDRRQALAHFVERETTPRMSGYGYGYARESYSEYGGDREELEDTLATLLGLASRTEKGADGMFRWVAPDPTKKLKAPKRKDLKLYPISRGAKLSYGEACIFLDDANHSVSYSSGQNNRAVERASEMKLSRTLFEKLGAMEWTRGSGGVLTGNDEYNQHSGDEEGRGANYVTRRFGPLGKADR